MIKHKNKLVEQYLYFDIGRIVRAWLEGYWRLRVHYNPVGWKISKPYYEPVTNIRVLVLVFSSQYNHYTNFG